MYVFVLLMPVIAIPSLSGKISNFWFPKFKWKWNISKKWPKSIIEHRFFRSREQKFRRYVKVIASLTEHNRSELNCGTH